MSISLNNHEQRIKTLENNSSGGISIRGAVQFNGSNMAINRRYGVISGVSRVSTGRYKISFSQSITNPIVLSLQKDATSFNTLTSVEIQSPSATSVVIAMFVESNGAKYYNNSDYMCVVVI